MVYARSNSSSELLKKIDYKIMLFQTVIVRKSVKGFKRELTQSVVEPRLELPEYKVTVSPWRDPLAQVAGLLMVK